MPLLDLVGDRGLQTVPGLGSEAVGRDRCRALLALDDLAHLIPHKREGSPKAMKPSQETPTPSPRPPWLACMVSAQHPLGSDTCPGRVGVPVLCSGCSGFWRELRAPGFLPSLLHPLLSRGQGEGSTDSHRPVRLPCTPHQHGSPGHRAQRQRHDLSPCPKSSDDLSQYQFSILQYTAECHTNYIV